MTEAEVGVMCFEEGGRDHGPRSEGGLWKLDRQRGRCFLDPPEGTQPCQPILDV